MDVILAAAVRCFFSKTLDALGVRADASFAELDPTSSTCSSSVGRSRTPSYPPRNSPRTVTQTVSSSAVTPLGRYRAKQCGTASASGGGGAWQHVYGGPRGDGHVHGLTFDPRDAGAMYAVTYCEGIIKSRDRGRSGRAINGGFVPGCRPPYDLEVDPRDSRILYALTPEVGRFKSTDGGGHWRRTPQP